MYAEIVLQYINKQSMGSIGIMYAGNAAEQQLELGEEALKELPPWLRGEAWRGGGSSAAAGEGGTSGWRVGSQTASAGRSEDSSATAATEHNATSGGQQPAADYQVRSHALTVHPVSNGSSEMEEVVRTCTK